MRVQPCTIVAERPANDTIAPQLCSINGRTTVKEFDELFPYSEMLEWGGRDNFGYFGPMHQHALNVAVRVGNLDLIRHIVVDRYSSHLLSYGNEYGIMPLHEAVLLTDRKKALEATHLLIRLGAQVNVATTKDDSSGIPKNATPLWLAAKKNDHELITLLLRKGATLNPLDEGEKKEVKETRERLIKYPHLDISKELDKIRHLIFPRYNESISGHALRACRRFKNERDLVFAVSTDPAVLLAYLPKELLSPLSSFYVYANDGQEQQN
jgi:ankyrin repeat protein